MGYFTRVNWLSRCLVIGVLFLTYPFQEASSIGAYPYPIEIVQPDGSSLTLRNRGDEWYNWTTTTDGYRVLKNSKGYYEYAAQLKSGELTTSGIRASNPDDRTEQEKDYLSETSKNLGISREEMLEKREEKFPSDLKSSLMSTHFPSEGEANLLVILADFNDTQPTYSTDEFDAFMNESGYEGTGSFKDYYEEVSGGKLTVNSTVTQWVQVPDNHDYYGPEEKWSEFALQAVQAAAEAGVDFSPYDNDGDGVVEGIAIIHQGAGEEVTANEDDIWSHSYSFSSAGVSESERTFDGVVVNQYTIQPEWRSNAEDMNTIGVICHEFGHNLGLLDFYDVEEEYYDGTGDWDIMASGAYNGSPYGSSPAHHNPFSKAELDWVDVTLIDEPATIDLNPVYNSGEVLRINSPVDNEYLLVENRQRTGFDGSIPGSGMLVYHTDGNLIEERRSTNTINVDEHQGFYPIAADGYINDPGCPFPGSAEVTELTDNTDPAMETWDGQPFNRSMTSIEMNNDVVSFDFMYIQDGSPIDFNATVADDQSIDLSWTLAEEEYPVLLAWSPDGEFGTPEDGKTYNAGETIEGGGTVLYYGNSQTSYLHDGLDPSTKYFYSVWSDKGDMYSRNLKDSGTTRPEPVTDFPWTDGFENGLVNWFEEFIDGSVSWTEEGPGFNDYPAEAYSGDSFASFYSASWNDFTTRLVSPLFELESDQTYYLTFRHIQAEWAGDQDELKVLVRPESTGNWEELAHYDQNIIEWGEHRLEIPYSEPVEIAFEGIANYGYGIGIDDVELKAATTCNTTPDIPVSDISASSITKTSMDISWTRGNGDGVLVVARHDTAIYELPDQGTDYTDDSEFGVGDQIAAGTYVVYNGTGEQVSLSGLEHTSDYHIAFFEYFSDGYCYENQPRSTVFSTEAEIHNITVNVNDAEGNLLENAMVRFDEDTLFTDTNGEVILEVTHSDLFHRLDVSKDNYTAKTERFVPDEQKTVNVILRPFTPLDPSELTGTNDYTTIELDWSPVIHENFDLYNSFATEIPGWTFIDKDEAPTYGIQNMTWPNEQEPMAFMLFGVYEEEVLQMEYDISSWSGDKVLAAFAAQEVQSNDWVVSPEFTVEEGDFFSFMAQTLDAGDWGKEVINVKVRASGETEWTTFEQGIEVPETWTRYEYDLANYVDQTVEVAVQSVGNQTFVLLLDDFRVGAELGALNDGPFPGAPANNVSSVQRDTSKESKKPSRKPKQAGENTISAPSFSSGNVEYNIYRGNEEIATVYGFANSSHIDEVPDCSEYEYTVRAVFPDVNMESDDTDPFLIESCYSVLFVVKTENDDLIEGAEVTFNEETKLTNADGEAHFTGIKAGDELPYTISSDDYQDIEDTTIIDKDSTIQVTMSNVNSSIEESWAGQISFSPNPVVSEGTLRDLPPGNWQIDVYDITGQKISDRQVKGGESVRWNFSGYRPGIYMMSLRSREGRTVRLKIININGD